MGTFTLTITTDNDAFGDYPQDEVARLLREVADRVEGYADPGKPIIDVNGNTVGSWTLS